MATKIRRGTDNIFRDLGFGVDEAAHLQLRSELMIKAAEAAHCAWGDSRAGRQASGCFAAPDQRSHAGQDRSLQRRYAGKAPRQDWGGCSRYRPEQIEGGLAAIWFPI